MICPGCGRESVADSVFCTYCGTKLRPDVPVDSHLLDDDRRALREVVATRNISDRLIPPWIAIIPFIINIIVGVIVMAAVITELLTYDIAAGEVPTEEELLQDLQWITVVAVIGGALMYAIYAAIAYALIDRSNKHLEREKRSKKVVTDLVQKIHGVSPGLDSARPWNAYGHISDVAVEGTRRNPLFWAFVITLPVFGQIVLGVNLLTSAFGTYNEVTYMIYLPLVLVHLVLLFYMLHFMTDEIWRHDVAWVDFATTTKVSLARAGVTAGMLEQGAPLKQRSSALYILASFLTFGIFLVYWWYVAVKDPNTHYENQARFEDGLLSLISGKT